MNENDELINDLAELSAAIAAFANKYGFVEAFKALQSNIFALTVTALHLNETGDNHDNS